PSRVGPAVLTAYAGPNGSDMSGTADPSSPPFIIVSDGQGHTVRLDRAAVPTIKFVGSVDGVDTVTISASGTAGGDLNYLESVIQVDLGDTPGDALIIRTAVADAPVRATITATTIGAAPGDTLFSGLNGARVEYAGLDHGTVMLDLGADAPAGNQVFVQSTSAQTTSVLGGTQGDEFRVGATAGVTDFGGLDQIGGGLSFDGRGGADTLAVGDYTTATANAAVRIGP